MHHVRDNAGCEPSTSFLARTCRNSTGKGTSAPHRSAVSARCHGRSTLGSPTLAYLGQRLLQQRQALRAHARHCLPLHGAVDTARTSLRRRRCRCACLGTLMALPSLRSFATWCVSWASRGPVSGAPLKMTGSAICSVMAVISSRTVCGAGDGRHAAKPDELRLTSANSGSTSVAGSSLLVRRSSAVAGCTRERQGERRTRPRLACGRVPA
jgi:hypothetical protein